ncbi:MAG TPA: RsmE family RNA methyltransferase [Candidatus Obscuribacter sp.]|nr:RsmE family RNA methyltransferase [Candidatus Obscuribacter sp.]
MREYRFFTAQGLLAGRAAGDLINLEDEALVHQVLNVLRLRAGARLTLLDGAGTLLQAELKEVLESTAGKTNKQKRRSLSLTVLEAYRQEEEREGSKVRVYLPLIKPARFEWALEKLTECGVDTICPVLCKRSTAANSESSKSTKKAERWQAIIKEAAEQCERLYLPELRSCRGLEQALAEDLAMTGSDSDLLLHLSERSDAPNIVPFLYNSKAANGITVAIVLGPEGGLTDEEKRYLAEQRFQPVSLGRKILRSETAAILAAASVRMATAPWAEATEK